MTNLQERVKAQILAQATVILVFVTWFASCSPPDPPSSKDDEYPSSEEIGGMIVLYLLDGPSCSYSFAWERPGLIVHGNMIKNVNAQLTYFQNSMLRVAQDGGAKGWIQDIGDLRDVRTHKSAMHGLRREQETVIATWCCDATELVQATPASGERQFELSTGKDSSEAKLGHIYLLKVEDEHPAATYVAFHVISMIPEQQLTIRWRTL